jgi:hypothetical protein
MKKLSINYSGEDNTQLINHLKQLNDKYSNTKFIKNKQVDQNNMKKNITPMILPNSESNINSINIINNNHLIRKHTPSQLFNYKSRENMSIRKQNPPMFFTNNYNALNVKSVEIIEDSIKDISFKIVDKKNNIDEKNNINNKNDIDEKNNINNKNDIDEKNNTSSYVNTEKKIKIFPPIYYINPYNNINIKDISCNFYEIYEEYSDISCIHEDDQLKNLPRTKYKSKPIVDIISLEKFILIVDFNNLGGGTSFFIESIVSRYKKDQTFLIVRNTNCGIYFTVNDEYQLEKIYVNEEACNLLKNNKDKIEKIFVNHILGHIPEFIHSLFDLKIQIDTITHDFFGIFGKWSVNFNDIDNTLSNESERCYVNINSYDHIITQNQGNLYIYNKFIKDKNKIIVSAIPDYKYTKDFVRTRNHNIVIGILGNISEMKGLGILQMLIEFYKNDKNINFVVFGKVNIYPFTNFHSYSNIEELNLLLTIHKPNMLIELSIWPETYSYTLSLAMITELPIIYLKKNNYCTVEDRLSKYDKAYPFTTVEEFNTLIYEKKQDYFYTIEPIIYFNKFWDDYFGKKNTSTFNVLSKSINNNITNYYYENNDEVINRLDISNKNIVLIVSKIVTSSKPFTYTQNRSIYTIDERFNQTLKTIWSIRNKIPNAFIVLVDNSKLNNYQINTLNHITDYTINITYDKILNYYTDDCMFKAFGEISQQLIFYKYFLSKIDLSKPKNFFKISGRYYINDTFDYREYDNNLTILKKNNTVTDSEYYYTSFYKISISSILDYFKLLNKIICEKNKYMINNSKNDFEVIMPALLNNKVNVNNLGITQLFSCWKIIDNV